MVRFMLSRNCNASVKTGRQAHGDIKSSKNTEKDEAMNAVKKPGAQHREEQRDAEREGSYVR